MAVLQQPTNHGNPFEKQIGDALAPVGTHVATVIDIKDEFGVERPKFQSNEREKVDLACFLFGFRDAQGNPHRVATKQMRISGNEKAALFRFLTSLLGRAPDYGWDYCSLKGYRCFLTVQHVQKRDGSGVFASIASISPIPGGMATAPTIQQPPIPRPVIPAPVAPPLPPQPVPAEAFVADEAPF